MSISSDSVKELLTTPKLIVINGVPQEDFVFRFGTGLINKRYDFSRSRASNPASENRLCWRTSKSL